ncbi:MAG: aldehyde dehydrogenase family protein [Actinomycetota bacterium]
MISELTSLQVGQPIVFDGNRVTTVPEELAQAFTAGDRLVVVADSGALLHIPERTWQVATTAVGRAYRAFGALGAIDDGAISAFYHHFADRLADDTAFAPIAAANVDDVASARERGRSTTRLELSATMRADMIDGLRLWADAPSGRDAVIETIEHDGWRLEQRVAGLGVVGFVFEGRPNVFADACGVLRSGNTVVFRIGSDALGTARAIVANALDPALAAAGLPPGSASLVDDATHAAGWAMFSDPRLALAVARGSGPAVAQLGAVARQVGTPVSLHGTGGAWIVTGEHCDPSRLAAVIANSLDRKVCNTVNTCCVLAHRADELVPAVLQGLEAAAAARGTAPKLHVTDRARHAVPPAWFDTEVTIERAEGPVVEAKAERLADGALGREWEWEHAPEITLTVVANVAEAVELFNTESPRFAASLISDDDGEQEGFWATVDAPFVGDGFTRWVDGQYALGKPELGLSNWQGGRLFGRGGVLSGDSVFTVRSRARQRDPDVAR